MKYTEKQLDLIKAHISDWRWRFGNLYWIQPAEADQPECVFAPRPEQWEILEAIYEKGETRLAILKARQLGFSTLLALIAFDMFLFNAGFCCGIIDQTQEDAKKKMDKIFFAWEKLPYDIKAAYRIETSNKSELAISRPNKPKSIIYAGMNARGGTHQFLWISEWGAIQFTDPKRSDEIADGGLPSAEQGIIVVETTWRGGKTGRLYTEVVEPALQISSDMRTREDWKVYFYPWWGDKRYTREGHFAQVLDECNAYLDEVENKGGTKLDKGQRLWYFKVAWVKRQKRYEEYPSLLEEIFKSPVEGAIYAPLMDVAQIEGRIIDFKASKEPFYTFWDLGKRDLMAIKFIQIVGTQVRVFDAHLARGETLTYYARYCQQWERDNEAFIGGHFLPHDGGWQRLGNNYNKSIAEMLGEAGLQNIHVVPRIPLIGVGIDQVRDRIPEMVFHATNLGRVYEFGNHRVSVLDSLSNYRYAPLAHNSAGRAPLHDINSHICDAIRTYAEADERGMVPRTGGLQRIEDDYQENQTGRANMGDFDIWE
ncbi:hypothetical protein OAI07_01290 [Akkermansiaceae bacterium]|nr:hypothetical protein [Akkermansiaceae bacterium]